MGAICHDYKNQHISLNEFGKLNNLVKKVIVQRSYHKVNSLWPCYCNNPQHVIIAIAKSLKKSVMGSE